MRKLVFEGKTFEESVAMTARFLRWMHPSEPKEELLEQAEAMHLIVNEGGRPKIISNVMKDFISSC